MTDAETLAALGGVALIAGFLDSIAGGGGLLCLPALLLSGLDPVAALATNKLQGTFGTATATYVFWKKGDLQQRRHWLSALMIFASAMLGVAAVAYAPKQMLILGLPPLLILIAIYFAFVPQVKAQAHEPRLPQAAFTFGFGPVIGFYDGIFGPGTGSFFMLTLTSLLGLGMVEATGRTKLFNFSSNLAALLLFACGGKVIWLTGLVMGLGKFIGAQVGAHTAIKNGAVIIRPLLVLVCLAMAVKLLLDPAHPIRALWT